jgi:DNA-directed RNA polymerase specialized sigma24 family protein
MGVEQAGPAPRLCASESAQSQERQELRRFGELRGVSEGSLSERPTRAPTDAGASPLEAAVGREAVRRYDFALAELDPCDREAVLGRMELHWPYEQLAEALDMSNTRAARALVIRAICRLLEGMSR